MVLLIWYGLLGFNPILLSFTFQYGSTYIKRSLTIVYKAIQIYIPVWFYLYDEKPDEDVVGEVIYIPVWFYLYAYALKASF